MNKLRILQLGSSSGLYGAERWILALVNSLDRNKVDTWVAAISDSFDMEPPLCSLARKAGFNTKNFSCKGKLSLSIIKDLKTFIQENDIQILHTHGYKTDLIGVMAVRGTACKIVTTPHGWTNNPDMKLWAYEAMDRMLFPFFDAVVPLSAALRQTLEWIPGIKSRLHLISNGVDLKEIESECNIAPEILSWKEQGFFVIGYIGRLTGGKGLDVLLKAVSEYGKPHWRVALIGEGEEEDTLKALVSKLRLNENVIFFGFRKDRLTFLNGFDVFTLPSRSEGIPRCLMEAMAARTPIVASDIPGCRYLIDSGKTGLLFSVDNHHELAVQLEYIDNNRSLAKDITSEAYKYVYAKYSANRMADEYTNLFFTLVN